jgi:hypothetical protein
MSSFFGTLTLNLFSARLSNIIKDNNIVIVFSLCLALALYSVTLYLTVFATSKGDLVIQIVFIESFTFFVAIWI